MVTVQSPKVVSNSQWLQSPQFMILDLGIRDSEARGIKSKKDTFGELQIVDYSLRQDGEVESFKLIPVADIANVIRNTEYFKPNCNLVIMDFLFRHRFIRPEQFGYLKLLQSLRSGDCS